MNREDTGIQIDLMQLVRVLIRNLKYIVLITALAGILGYVGSSMLITPIYQAGAKMIVNTRKDDTQNVTNDQINSAKNLVETYSLIIRSRDVLNQVISDLNLPESYGQLSSCVKVTPVNETTVIQITVQHASRETALAITSKIVELAPNAILEKVVAGSVRTVEQPYAGDHSVSTSPLYNAILIAMAGFILSCAVVVVIYLSDNTYKNEMDVQRDLDFPLLGVIPTAESVAKINEVKEKGVKEYV